MIDLLDNFLNDENFPTQTVFIYNYSSVLNPLTGEITKGYKLQESREVWILPQATLKKLYTDKITDELTNVMLTDQALDSTDVVNYGDTWYSCKISDDILFDGQVVQIGLIKIDKPDVIDEEAEDETVLGDSTGVL